MKRRSPEFILHKAVARFLDVALPKVFQREVRGDIAIEVRASRRFDIRGLSQIAAKVSHRDDTDDVPLAVYDGRAGDLPFGEVSSQCISGHVVGHGHDVRVHQIFHASRLAHCSGLPCRLS